MKPKPFESLNHFTVPLAISTLFREFERRHAVRSQPNQRWAGPTYPNSVENANSTSFFFGDGVVGRLDPVLDCFRARPVEMDPAGGDFAQTRHVGPISRANERW